MRDLTTDEQIALERMVDEAGLQAVLMDLSTLCGLVASIKAIEHQDAHAAKWWATMEGALGVLVTRAEGL